MDGGCYPWSKSSPLLQDGVWLIRSAKRAKEGRGLTSFHPGHSGVTGSLRRGLHSLSVEYKLNPYRPPREGPVGILAGVRALEWAVGTANPVARQGCVVGPNVSVLASEAPSAFLSDRVRAVLVPSTWVLNHWLRDTPELDGKLRVWACGVDFDYWRPPEPALQQKVPLIYRKINWPGLEDEVKAVFRGLGVPFRELVYGSHSPKDYRRVLAQTSCVVYLGGSESQGIALLEAWAMNVPTFVYDAPYQEIHLTHGRVDVMERGQFSPAPYLEPEYGSMWRDPTELVDLSSAATRYAPRSKARHQFSDEAGARVYLQLIQEALSADSGDLL